MTSIFKNAYFGKVYKTRDERKAVYGFCIKGKSNEHYLIVDKVHALLGKYADNGILDACGYCNKNLDIVSEWKEEIPEEKYKNELNNIKEDIEIEACIYEDSCHNPSIQQHFIDGANYAIKQLLPIIKKYY